MKKRLPVILLAFFICYQSFSQQHQLEKLWESDTTFKVPESVFFDAANKMLYVANIDGQPWEKDGKGSISKLSPEGKIVQHDWITGLNAPKGMSIYKKRLYVADMDEIVVIDISKGSVVEKIKVDGALGLNDVSVSNSGVIYVSDSRAKRILAIQNGKVDTLLQNLNGPNGVLAHGNDFYILDQGGMYKVGKDKSLKLIVDGMEGGTDGIEHVKGGEFIVSCWSGAIWYVSGEGKKELLLDTREAKINSADIGYDAKNRIVYVPTFWKNGVVAYKVK